MNKTDEVIEHQEEEIVDTQEDNVFEDAEQEVLEQEAPEQDFSESQDSEVESKQVPLEALKKERRKRQEAEMNAAYQYQQLQEMQRSKEPEDDSEKYQSATQEDLQKSRNETVQLVEERIWVKANPEKKQIVDENLTNFLKQRPNYASAIDSATNRYEEAYELMEALNPRQKKQLKSVQKSKKEAPNSPASVPKSAAMNNAVDVMSMNDKEYLEWRKSKSVRR